MSASIATASRASALGSEYPGIDVRAKGGYVVAPPSVHISGAKYEWEASSPDEPGAVPPWLAALLTQRQRERITGKDDDAPIIEGRRNETLARVGGRLRRQGMTSQAIEDALLAMNARQCVPPLSGREVSAIAQSIGRYPVTTLLAEEPASPFKLLSELDAAHFFARQWRRYTLLCEGGWLVSMGPEAMEA